MAYAVLMVLGIVVVVTGIDGFDKTTGGSIFAILTGSVLAYTSAEALVDTTVAWFADRRRR